MMPLKIGEGHIFHTRKTEVDTKFTYPTFFLHFNVDHETELHQLFRRKFFGLFSLRATDYLDGRGKTFASGIREFLQLRLKYEAEEIWLQTMPRIFGYAFNPVSFWILKRAGEVEAVLCEVNNTFGERHFYWIHPSGQLQAVWHSKPKVFHVSPFQPTDGSYNFRFQFSQDKSSVDINYLGPQNQLRLATWIKGDLLPAESKSLAGLLWRYGWMTPLVVVRIHSQALYLWLKKVQYVSKPPPPKQDVTT